MRDTNKYEEEWATIDSLRQQGLPQSLFTKVDAIYRSALAAGNDRQFIKAIIYRLNAIGLLEENDEGANKIFRELNDDAARLTQPAARSVVYSILGQMYEDFYDRNAWTINRRTSTVNDPENIHTWDARRLLETALTYYDFSLRDAGALQREPVDRYKEILHDGYDPALQPTLYDLLANRALAFYASEFNAASLAAGNFSVNDPDFFADAETFAALAIQSSDTLSPLYLSLKTYRDLLRFHLERSRRPDASDPPQRLKALIEVDLRRMAFVRSKGRYADNDQLYEKALIAMSETCKPYDANASVLLRLGGFYLEQGAKWRLDKAEKYRSGYAKARQICDRLTSEYPDQLRRNAEALKANILHRELELKIQAVQLPGKPFPALLKYRNLDTLHILTRQLTAEQALDYACNLDRYREGKYYGLPEFLQTLSVEPAKSRRPLPPSTDYQYLTTEIKIQPHAKGFYLLTVSDTDDPSSATIQQSFLLQVSSLAAQHRMVDRSMTVLITDRETGQPVHGAKVTACKREQNRHRALTTFTSNRDGIARSGTMPDYYYNEPYTVDTPEDHLTVFGAGYNRDTHRRQDTHPEALLFTDRSLYRPGQTVYFKAILYNRSGARPQKLLPETSVRIYLRDANRQILSEQNLVTNDFGSLAGHFTIPQGLLNGNMTIECPGYASTRIRVEEYKRPTFEVKFDPVAGSPTLNGAVRVTATAKALAGYAIDHAGVRYRVVRSTRYRYYHGWYPPISDNREITSGLAKTDAQGAFAVEFTALADDVDDDRLYTYTVTADVTDLNGETRSASLPVHAGRKPLLIAVNLPDEIPPGGAKANTYTVETTNLNGDATPATVNVKITALKAPGKILRQRLWNDPIDLASIPEDEFRKDFPLDARGDELNPDRLEELNAVAEYTLKTPQDRRLDLSSMQHSGYYKIRLTADDGKGLVTEEARYVYLSGDKPETIPDMSKWFTVVKREGEPGEQAEFRIAGGREESVVYCELIHLDRIVEAKWIKTGTTPVRLTYPIREEHRGGFLVQLSMVQDNRIYTASQPVTVPHTDKMLDLKLLSTFRDKLLPGQPETWTLSVSDRKGEKAAAEIAATLYDASLDAIQPHSWPELSTWYFSTVNPYAYRWETPLQNLSQLRVRNPSSPEPWQNTVFLTDLNWFDATYRNVFSTNTYASDYSVIPVRMMTRSARASAAAPAAAAAAEQGDAQELKNALVIEEDEIVGQAKQAKQDMTAYDGGLGGQAETTDLSLIETRVNFNETAFFYPQLRTNGKGETLIEFTMPEALTRWKLLSFAHTQDLKAGTYSNELITQKQVAISANAPRFFRENDVIELTAKVNNLTESSLDGRALLRLHDAVTLEPVDEMIQSKKTLPFDVKAGESVVLRWTLAIPSGGLPAVVCKVTAQAGTHTDGEEKTIPVLTNSMLVTETLPFSVRAGGEKTFTLNRLVDHSSRTLRHHSLTLEFTSAPAWYAVQALPYIMEYPYECAEQTFSRYYANTLAAAVVNRTPRIKRIFELWNAPDSKALMSNLEKNQELKQVMLEETPWVMQAGNDAERKKRIGLLFDLNRMSSERNRAFNRLQKIRNSDGGLPWFDGLPSNRHITQHIVAGMAHLKKLDAMPPENVPQADEIIREGLRYLDFEIRKDHEALIRNSAEMEKRQITALQLHYLYACSFDQHQPDEQRAKTAFDYYLKQAGEYWNVFSTYEKALAVLVLHRNNQPDKAGAILRSLKETAQQSEELGMYWKDNVAGYFWHQAPVETQAMLIEAFHEAAHDAASVEEMKIWLLRNKQTNDWKTTKATSEAIYALLMTGGNLLDESKLPEIEIGGTPLAKAAKEAIRPEPGTGYVKTNWSGGEITPRMGSLKVGNPNRQGIIWGGLYWQYFEQLDKITSAETNLKMNKRLYLRTLTANGERLQPIDETHQLRVGDLVRVRMELKADRDYEYVHLKDMRASAFEPVSVRSGSRHQDGLWYYENIKDASTSFFITHLHKGVYVFEYDLRASHAGDFSNGVTTIQCMYAPEFSSHSEGIRLKISRSE
jgi:hypothetical protein